MNESLEFGTDGIRGNASLFPFTPDALQRLGYSLGLWMQKKYGDNAQLLLGADTRISCSTIKTHLLEGLSSFKIHIVDAGVIPTPALFQLIHYNKKFNCGLMISASHNPYQDNGIKLFDAQTGKLTPEDEISIATHFATSHLSFEKTNPLTIEIWNNCQKHYLSILKRFFQENFLKGLKIVLDCAHGATFSFAPTVFEYFGAEILCIGNQPNGKNINDGYGALHSEKVQEKVLRHNAHLGIAFDGDGDRVIMVNHKGEIKDGDDILCMLMQLPEYQNQRAVVGTVMTNSGFELIIKNQGRSLLRTSVGDKYVASKMEEENLLLGGETSGHIILKDYLSGGDGIFVALRVISSLQASNNWEMKTFNKMPQIILNVPVTYKHDLKKSPFAEIIDRHQKTISPGRILVRYSGTENLLRIMTEAPNQIDAQEYAQTLAAELVTPLK